MSTLTRRSSVPLNVLTATTGIALLVGALALVDTRIREELAHILTGQGSTTQLGGAFATIQQSVGSTWDIVRDQAVAYGPLSIFGVAAVLLLFFMTRIKF